MFLFEEPVDKRTLIFLKSPYQNHINVSHSAPRQLSPAAETTGWLMEFQEPCEGKSNISSSGWHKNILLLFRWRFSDTVWTVSLIK